jgi:ABC-type bacteriocin/lantibiotic exporter with double-glycine peptidase domain
MGIYKYKYSMNFLMNLCHQLGIAGVLGIGGWFVVSGQTQVGTVVAFISGLATVKSPWDDLASWYQTMMVTRARYQLLSDVLLTASERELDHNR